MSTLRERDRESIWHPYTPMKIWPESIAITRGEGVYLFAEDGKKYIDAISSWWVNLHGHSHPYIAKKISEQLLTLEHAIFAGFTHAPAVELAERLLQLIPGHQSRIFYSDNGSTAVEVALKMALQYWTNKGVRRNKIVALEQAYHGDTFGAMSVSARSSFTEAFGPYLFETNFIPFPSPEKSEKSIRALENLLQRGDVAAFIAEPMVQGAAGMYMYGAETLESYFRLCKKYDVLIIADEVMTGFGRTDTLFVCDRLQTAPDMVCLSKGLTGGTMPLGVTACSQAVFDAFLDDDRSKTLYHGHSYTANPLACTAGLASLDLLLTESTTSNRKMISREHLDFCRKIRDHHAVGNVRCLGTILAIELNLGTTSYNHVQRDRIYNHFIEQGILLRPLGNIIYILPPFCITGEQLACVYSGITTLLNAL
jgi:adenosylmethionine---8-amino-7-oxononanoate aminotransferase